MSVWYSYKGIPYKGSCPAYYDLSGLEWYDELVERLPEIQSHTIQFLNNSDVARRPYFNTEIIEGNAWDGVSFMFWNKTDKDAIQKGEKLFGYFCNIPGLVSLSISLLHPSTHIKEHYGDTDAVWRLHIPVVIPSSLPDCGLRVNGIDKAWDMNQVIAFCDGHLHEAWNNTGDVRVVIIADIVKEELLGERADICYNVLSMLALQKLYLKSKLIYISPWFVKGTLRHFLKWWLMVTS